MPKEQPLAAALKAIQQGAQEILVREREPHGQEGQVQLGPLLILGLAAVAAIVLTMRKSPYPNLPFSPSEEQRANSRGNLGEGSPEYSALSSLR